MDFASRLRKAMSHAAVNDVQLAAALGISKQAVGQQRLGKSQAMSAENCARSAIYLGVEWLWLATGEGEMVRPKEVDAPMSLSAEERDVILALRVLGASERAELMQQITTLARAQVQQLQALIDRQNGVTSPSVVPIRRPG